MNRQKRATREKQKRQQGRGGAVNDGERNVIGQWQPERERTHKLVHIFVQLLHRKSLRWKAERWSSGAKNRPSMELIIIIKRGGPMKSQREHAWEQRGGRVGGSLILLLITLIYTSRAQT